jgi:predicted dehydrogenase
MKINVAIVSTGGAGRAHISRFNKNIKSCVKAIFDIKKENLNSFSWIKKNGGYITTDFNKIITDDSIDLISICSPDYSHFDYALAAINAGKHVLVEKPMVTSIEQCQKLSYAISNHDTIFAVHHQMRYVPCFMSAKMSVINGDIGMPIILEADYVHDMRERASLYDDWRLDSKNFQKVVLGMSSHTIDLARWILNDEVNQVFSYANHNGWTEYPDVDTVMTLLKFNRGTICKIMSTVACQRPQLNSLVIYGNKGSIINNLVIDKKGPSKLIHTPKNIKIKILSKLLLGTRSKLIQNIPFSMYEHEIACKSLIDDLLNHILEGTDFPVNFSEGAYTTQICLASIESYEKGVPIMVKRMF